MKKTNITILFVLIIFLSVACSNHPDYSRRLVEIDSLIIRKPDTALLMLEALPENLLHTQADSAYYALLVTEARDKNYIVQTDDSLIQSALAYYRNTSDTEKQARVYYYSGCVYRDSQKEKEAITQYLTALPLAKQTEDEQLLSLIYLNLAHLYYAQDLNAQADSIYQLAMQLGIRLKDSVLQAEILSQQGLIRLEKGEAFYPEAEKMMQKALEIIEKQPNLHLKRNIFSSLSVLYNRMQDGEKAVRFAKLHLAAQTDSTSCYNAYKLLGSAYYKAAQYDSALYYLHKALPTTDYTIKAGIYMRLADIAKEQGDLATSLEMERNYSAYLDSIKYSRHPQEIINAENKLQILQQKQEYDSSINERTYFFLLLVGVIILIAFFSLKRYRNHAKQMQDEMEKLHNDEAQKQKLCSELDELNTERNCLLQESFNHSDVHNKMRRIIHSFQTSDKSDETMEEEDWLQLIAETDRCHNNITLRLQSEYSLTQEEIQLCCLYLANLPITHLSYLLNCTRDTIYKRANRILEQKMNLSRKETSLKETLKKLC